MVAHDYWPEAEQFLTEIGLEARGRLASAVECAAVRAYPRAMNKGTGTGLIAFGVVLGVVGGVMAFAITVRTKGFNINTAGWILLVVGVIVLVIGIAILVTGSRRSSTTVENVQNTPTGQERVEEKRDWGTP
jgi:protein-S-isoprenylcysteine O-methyltransferase Ste14